MGWHWKIATDSEPASYTFAGNGTHYSVIIACIEAGTFDASNPIAARNLVVDEDGSTLDIPSLAVPEGGGLGLLGAFGLINSFNPPAGWDQVADLEPGWPSTMLANEELEAGTAGPHSLPQGFPRGGGILVVAPGAPAPSLPNYKGTLGSLGGANPLTFDGGDLIAAGIDVVEGDVMLALVETANETASVSDAEGAWTELGQVGTGTAATQTGTRLTAFGKVVGPAGWQDTTVADSGDHQAATILVFDNVDTANPWELVDAAAVTGLSGSLTIPSVEVPFTHALAVLTAVVNDDTSPQVSGWANDTVTVTERIVGPTGAGSDGTVAAATAELPEGGATGATTITVNAGNQTGAWAVIALRSPDSEDLAPTAPQLDVALLVAGGNEANPSETYTTPSFTPTAGATLFAFMFAEDAGNGPSLATHDHTIAGGSLTWERVVSMPTPQPWDGLIDYTASCSLWRAEVGPSPSSMSVTFDAFRTSGWHALYSVVVLEVTSETGEVHVIQAMSKAEEDAGGDAETHTTGVLPSPATPGNLALLCVGAAGDDFGPIEAPSGWETLVAQNTVWTHAAAFYRSDFAGTSVTITDLGEDVGNSASVLLELSAEGGTEPEPASGTATGSWSYEGTASGTAPELTPASGTATGSWSYEGAAAGYTEHRGTATGSRTRTGAASGHAEHRGEGSGAWGYVGTAEGRAPSVGEASGTAEGVRVYVGTATGSTEHHGTAEGVTVYVGAASGHTEHRGTAEGVTVYVGAAVGRAPSVGEANGRATGSWSYEGAATGSASYRGSAEGTRAYEGAATGSTEHHGSAAGVRVYVGTAQGRTPDPEAATGRASGVRVYVGTAEGSTDHHGAAEGVTVYVGAASGHAPVVPEAHGSAEGVRVYVGTVEGRAIHRGSAQGARVYVGLAIGPNSRPVVVGRLRTRSAELERTTRTDDRRRTTRTIDPERSTHA